jgi:hypothetical protein
MQRLLVTFIPQQKIKLMMCRTASTRDWNVFDKFPKYHMKILLGEFNAKVGREDIFKPLVGNESLYKFSNDNGVRLVNFATSKNLRRKYNVPTSQCRYLLAYADDVNLLGDNIDSIKKNTETLTDAGIHKRSPHVPTLSQNNPVHTTQEKSYHYSPAYVFA